MKAKLVGALHKKGSFPNENGVLVEFNNIALVLLVPPSVGGQYDPVAAVGDTVETIGNKHNFPSFNIENISAVFGPDVTNINDIQKFIGKDVDFFYDRSKKICSVKLLPSKV